MQPGPATTSSSESRLGAEQVIAQLKYLQAYEINSSRLLGGWMPGIARWETKHTIGLHLWQDAEASRDLRTRLWELRVANPDRDVAPLVESVVSRLASAQADHEFLAGLYLVLKDALVTAYQGIVNRTSAVYDAPTIAVIQGLLPHKLEQLRWAKLELDRLADSDEKRRQVSRWIDYCRRVLRQAGGANGEPQDRAAESEVVPLPGYASRLPFAQAARDERFQVRIRGLDLPSPDDRAANLVFQFFNYSQEMQAAETLGSMLWETEGMEWEFYYDVARHCYDEIRHSSMGEARLRELGHLVTEFPNSTANYAWRQLLDPVRRYCVLTYVIEADGFKYKHQTYQAHLKNQDFESAEAVLFDIMDETMHVRMGQKWVPKLMERYKYREPLEKLIAECRDILLANSVVPTQRLAATEVASRA